jgi:hypothetical protein
MTLCNCGNPDFGFDCVCAHIFRYPGNIEYYCDICGFYEASRPRCNLCEVECSNAEGDIDN